MPARSARTTEPSKPTRSSTRARSTRSKTTIRRRRPDRSAIAERAYYIHLEEGSSDELANWLRAERELTAA